MILAKIRCMMLQDDLLRANIENLSAFWAACGAEDHVLDGGGVLHRSRSWPWRLWFDYGYRPNRHDLGQLLEIAWTVEGPVTIPQWHWDDASKRRALEAGGYEVKMRQEAMVATFADIEPTPPSVVSLRWLTEPGAAGEWTRVASAGFGYAIDETVIAGLVGVPGFHLVVAGAEGTAVGAGLLFHTGRIAGLHMLGVPKAHRRRGYARQIMFGLLALARELGCEHATLQASNTGKPLYKQVGFRDQGIVRSFRRS